MFKDKFPSLSQGFLKLKNNPQLWYTILVAFGIVFAFIFITDRFVTIAQDAQDRLVNIRLGSMQDSFVKFAPDYINTERGRENLNKQIQKIVAENQSIRDFKIVSFEETNEPIIIASLNRNNIGEIDVDNNILYGLVRNDSTTSYTLESIRTGERTFTTARSIVDTFNQPIGAVITEQSLSEADLKINQDINNAVVILIVIVVLIMLMFFRHTRIIDYATLYKKLQEVDQLKDDFISMASHELRSPLALIRGYTEMATEAKDLKSAQESHVKIDMAAKELDHLVSDMLDVSRIEQGRMKINMEKLNPVPLIDEYVKSFSILAKAKGLSLKLENNLPKNTLLNLDKDRFRQVMTNLLSNAVKYSEKGQIIVKLNQMHDFVSIRVSDTGIGMSQDQQANLFKKFYRVHTEKTSKIVGTGLGLWITKQIIENMNGRIHVESIQDVGTHFVVDFPNVKNS